MPRNRSGLGDLEVLSKKNPRTGMFVRGLNY